MAHTSMSRLQAFAEDTSVDSLARAINSVGLRKKLMWTGIFLAGLGVSCYQIGIMAIAYLQYDKTVDVMVCQFFLHYSYF